MNSLMKLQGYIFDEKNSVWTRSDNARIDYDYSDGEEIEQRLKSIIENTADLGVLSKELFSHCVDWVSTYHLSACRANLLRPFESWFSGSILEIGAGCGAITRYLGECGGNVLALEGSPVRASITRARTRDLKNVTVVVDDFNDFFLPGRTFDVVLMIGVLEYASFYSKHDNPALAMLEHARSFLDPEGILIVAIENQLGLKYFAGAPEDHVNMPMYGIEGRYRKDQPQTWGREKLSGLLKKAQFSSVEFLAPFPDYKLPVSIVSETGACCDDFDAAALAWQAVHKDRKFPESCFFSLERAWSVVTENRLMIELANSFLICARLSAKPALSANQLAWHFGGPRLSPYMKQTEFYRHADGNLEVRYKRLGDEADLVQPGKLIDFNIMEKDTYKPGVSLLQKALSIVGQDGWHTDDMGRFLVDYINILYDCLGIEVRKPGISIYSNLPGYAFDLVPQNIIALKSGGHDFIDMEWTTREPVELGYLLFRTLKSVLYMTTLFGRFKDEIQLTERQFIYESTAAAGFPLKEQDVNRYYKLEDHVIKIILWGHDPEEQPEEQDYLAWGNQKIQSNRIDYKKIKSLEMQLEKVHASRLYVEKINAEKLACERLSKIESLEMRATRLKIRYAKLKARYSRLKARYKI